MSEHEGGTVGPPPGVDAGAAGGHHAQQRPYPPEPAGRERPDRDGTRPLLSRVLKRFRRTQTHRGTVRESYTPWLVIRDAPGDMGQRPIPMAAMNWTSPDIWVESSSPLGNAVLGQENFLHARVFNFGAASAYPVRVDFYQAFGMMGIVEEGLNHLGTEWVSVDSQRSVDVRCRTPFIAALPQVEGGMVIEGFYTFVVNCTSYPEDPIKHPFEPWSDRHCGTRNVLVMEAGGGGGGVIVPPAILTNPTPMSGRGRVLVRVTALSVGAEAARGTSQLSLVNRVAAFRNPWFASEAVGGTGAILARSGPGPVIATRSRRSRPLLRAELSGHVGLVLPSDRWAAAARRTQAASGRGGARRFPSEGFHVIAEGDFGAFDQQRLHLDLTLPADARPGDWFVLDLGFQVGDLPVGGCTFLVKVS